MVMKVIYLEDNQIADPVDTSGNPQRVLDLRPSQDALQTADRLGRPVAILRIGSRVPNVSEAKTGRLPLRMPCLGYVETNS